MESSTACHGCRKITATAKCKYSRAEKYLLLSEAYPSFLGRGEHNARTHIRTRARTQAQVIIIIAMPVLDEHSTLPLKCIQHPRSIGTVITIIQCLAGGHGRLHHSQLGKPHLVGKQWLANYYSI